MVRGISQRSWKFPQRLLATKGTKAQRSLYLSIYLFVPYVPFCGKTLCGFSCGLLFQYLRQGLQQFLGCVGFVEEYGDAFQRALTGV